MPQTFTGQYFTQSNGYYAEGVRTAILNDTDLIRGDDANESVTTSTGFQLFNGLQEVDFVQKRIVTTDDGEVTTTVTFSDGSTLAGVLGLYDRDFGPYASLQERFLLDEAALTAVGKTLADVTGVTVNAFVDHDLSWADFGFTSTGGTGPDPEPEPEPEPALNLVQGTGGADRLFGTSGDDLIRGGDGDDRLTGRAGADTFVFGADAQDGSRDRDVITDFNAAEDTIWFEAGAEIRSVQERNGNVIIQLEGDRDVITVLNADLGIVANFEFSADLLIA